MEKNYNESRSRACIGKQRGVGQLLRNRFWHPAYRDTCPTGISVGHTSMYIVLALAA